MKKKIVIVSVCSNIDLMMLGCMRNPGVVPGFGCEINKFVAQIHQANFKYPNGEPVLKFIEVTDEYFQANYIAKNTKDVKEVKKMKKKRRTEILVVDGIKYRSRGIKEITGYEIREAVEKHYGKDVIIIMIGGIPCQQSTRLNHSSSKYAFSIGFNQLIHEFPRILREGNFDLGIFEEIPQIRTKDLKNWNKFLQLCNAIPYNYAYEDMNGILYDGCQSRWREIMPFVRCDYTKQIKFPKDMPELAKRSGEVIDCDIWWSGHFKDRRRTKFDYFTTVTSGSPKWFAKIDKAKSLIEKRNVFVKRDATPDDKSFLMGVKPGELIIPKELKTPQDELHQAFGNGVQVALAYHVSKTLIEEVLCLKPDGNGYWIPNETPSEPSPDNGGSATPIDILTVDTTTISKDGNVLNETSEEQKPSKDISNVTKVPKPEELKHIHDINSKKIISSQHLKNMHFDTYSFQGKWNAFLGNPSDPFHLVIHGLPGQGKSHLAVQLANYLACHFGKAIYVSGEEGFSFTFQAKFFHVCSTNLDVADLRCFDDIIREIVPESYKFIFIDSLDTTKIGVDEMRFLRTRYKSASLITISQSTKGGLMRGSQEIIHDSDIAIEVLNLVAKTTKNRFMEKGMTYEVFPEILNDESTETE